MSESWHIILHLLVCVWCVSTSMGEWANAFLRNGPLSVWNRKCTRFPCCYLWGRSRMLQSHLLLLKLINAVSESGDLKMTHGRVLKRGRAITLWEPHAHLWEDLVAMETAWRCLRLRKTKGTHHTTKSAFFFFSFRPKDAFSLWEEPWELVRDINSWVVCNCEGCGSAVVFQLIKGRNQYQSTGPWDSQVLIIPKLLALFWPVSLVLVTYLWGHYSVRGQKIFSLGAEAPSKNVISKNGLQYIKTFSLSCSH